YIVVISPDCLTSHFPPPRCSSELVVRVHPLLRQEIEALDEADTEAGCEAFDRLLWKHLFFACSGLMRATGRAWSAGRLSSVPRLDRKRTRLYFSHVKKSYAVFCFR